MRAGLSRVPAPLPHVAGLVVGAPGAEALVSADGSRALSAEVAEEEDVRDDPELRGAVYAEQIPVYQSAQVTDMIGGVTSDLDGGEAYHQASWWLESSDSREDIEAWYESQLPNVSKISEDWGDGPVTVYSWVPEGGKPGEELSIVISNDDIQVTETIQGVREDW